MAILVLTTECRRRFNTGVCVVGTAYGRRETRDGRAE
jgi:hypothetical protein